MNVKKLIEEIICDLANNVPLSSVVSKIQVVSKLIKNDEFRLWIENEFIYSYLSISELPNYRNISVSNVKASFLRHQGFGRSVQYTNFDLPVSNIGTEHYQKVMTVAFKEKVSLLEQILLENKSNISISLHAFEKLLIQEKILIDCEVINIHKEISRYDIQNIIDTAKSKLLDIFIELNDTVFNDEISFNMSEKKDTISKIVNQTINAGVYISENSKAEIQDSTIIGGEKNQMNISPNFEKTILELINKIEDLSKELDVEREEIAYEIVKIKLALEKKEPPQVIKSAFNSIKGIASSVVANEITELLKEQLPIIFL